MFRKKLRRWQVSSGIAGRFQPESVATFAGMAGRFQPEYARMMRQRAWAIVGVPLQIKDRILVQWFNRKSASDGKDVEWERYADLFDYEGQPLVQSIPSPHVFLYAKEDLLYAVDMSLPNSGEDEGNRMAIVIYRLIEKVE